MKFIVSSSALSARMQAISRVINAKNTLPILDCFLFDIRNNEMKITASDSETTLVTSLPLIESDAELRFCVNANKIQESVKEIAEQPLELDINPESMEVTGIYQNGRFTLMGQKADDYPDFNLAEDDMHVLTMTAEAMLNGISQSLFATGNENLRQVMNGIYFDIQNDNLTFVATDGNKLVRNKNFNIAGNEPSAFILPKKPANLLKNLLPKEAGDVTLKFNGRNAVIITETFRLTCRLIEGRYPNYNSVIPQNNPFRTTVDRMTLLSAIRRVLIFSNQGLRRVKLHLENGEIVVSGQDIDYATSAEEHVTCDYNGTPINIGFNGTFLVDILGNISSETVLVELGDTSRPGLILPGEQAEKEELLVLLMPMMLDD